MIGVVSMKVLQQEFYEKLKQITKLSAQVNDNDREKLLSMMNDHAVEITDLYHKQDDHYRVETADLIVLCFELLILDGKNIDDVFARCLPRFDKKLHLLLKEKQGTE